jgi:hypothetical protein
LFPPQFTNIPTTIAVQRTAAVPSVIFTVTATDQDLKVSRRFLGLFVGYYVHSFLTQSCRLFMILKVAAIEQ